MTIQTLRNKATALGFGLALLIASGWANADPPSRVARLGFASGSVSFSPAGDPDWLQAVVNRPMTTGDRLWVAANARAELQVGGAAIRLGPATSVTLLNLNDRIAQVRLSQGSLKVRVRRMGPNQSFEINTPNLAFTLRAPGEYRIDVDLNDNATVVMVQSGRGEVYGEGASYVLAQRRSYRFYGTGLSDYESMQAKRDDALDRWARERDRRVDNSKSARYLSSNVVGYEDLDANGVWRSDPNYGNVWIPNRVAAGWTPYRNGHWTWVDPWGWTWVDDAPWGYAVSHYGRWANLGGSWAWVPGPQREQAVYAPALVAFVGGRNFQGSAVVSGAAPAAVGWFPLAPREVYQPSYPVSRGYFDNINRSNAVIAPATITNVYNTTSTVINNTTVVNNTTNVNRLVYANQAVAGAVVAVPALAFVQSQPVAKVAVVVSKEAAVAAQVATVAAVVPIQQSVHGGAAIATAKPTGGDRVVVARTELPAPPVAFAIQQVQLAVKPGTPIDDAQRAQLKTATPVEPAPKVSVVASVQAPAPQAAPPAIAPAGKSQEDRRADAAKADVVKADLAKGDAVKAEAAKVDAAKAEAAKVDAAKAEAAKADATKASAAKAEAGKTEAARAEAAKAEAAKAASTKLDAAKADAAKAEAAKLDAAKAEAAKAEAAKASAAKAEAGKADAARAEAAKVEAAKVDAARADAAKAAAAKAEAGKADVARAEAAKVEAAKAEAAKAEAAKADAAKAAAAKAEAAKAEAARADAAKVDAAKAEAAKADAAKAAAAVAKAEASKAEAARAEAAKVDAAKAEAAKADAAKAAAAKAEASKAEAARAEAVRAEAAKVASAKADAARVEAAKAEAAKAASAKVAAAKADETNAALAKPSAAASAAIAAATSAAAPPAREAPGRGQKSELDAKADEEEKKKKLAAEARK